jgi:hypothetical protein
MQKYPMCTDAVTSRSYVYFPPKNIWKEIKVDGFFKQLIYEFHYDFATSSLEKK